MAIRLQERLDAGRGRGFDARWRWVARIALLVVIAVVAAFRGYSTRAWLLLGLVVLWAASLPFLLHGLRAELERRALPPSLRTTIVVMAALVLLAAFAVGVKALLPR